MAKITTILSNTTEVVHNNTQGLNDGDYIHLTQLEKYKFDAIQDITQYTNELAQDAIGSILTDSSTIDITYDDVTPSISAIIKPNSIGSTELSNSINISEFVNDSNYETTSQLNIRDNNNRDRNNHTGTQLSSTISDFNIAARTAVVSESINNGVLDKSPSENIVHDKLLLKQNLPTGYVAGLTLSIHPTDNTKAIIDVGGYIITDFTDIFNVQAIPVEVLVPIEFTPAYLLTNPSTYVALDINKNVISSITPFDNDDRRNLCIIGNVVHSNLTNINVVNEIKAPILAPTNQLHDLIKAVGFLNLEGNTISANGANLSLNKTAGLIWGLGINANNYTDPHRLILPEQTSLTFRYRLSVSPIVEFANTTLLDPTQYESSPGVLSPLSNNNRWSVQHLNIFQSGIARIQPAQHEHSSFIDARNAAFTESFVTESNISENAIFRCYIIMKKTCTNLSADIASGDAEIIHVGKFGNAVGGSNAALTLANILAVLGYTPENVSNKQNSLTVDGTGIKYPTVDAVNSEFSNKVSELSAPDYFYTGSLFYKNRVKQAKLSTLATLGGGTQAPTNIVVIGDSMVALSAASFRDASSVYGGINALGFNPFYSNNYGGEITYNTTGSVIATRNDTSSNGAWGVCGSRVDASAGATLTIAPIAKYRFDAFHLWYNKVSGGGTFTYSIDGGTAVTVDTNNATEDLGILTVSAGMFGNSTHTIVLTVTAGSVRFYGIDFYNKKQGGTIVHVLQSGGSRAQEWNGRTSYVQQFISTMSPASAIVFLGTNDAATGRSGAQYISDLNGVISGLSLPSTCAPTIMTPIPIGLTFGGLEDTVYGALITDYRTQALSTSKLNGWSFFDSKNYWPSYSYASANGMYQDAIHPSLFGAQYLFSGLMKNIFPVFNNYDYYVQPTLRKTSILFEPGGINGIGTIFNNSLGDKTEVETGLYFKNSSSLIYKSNGVEQISFSQNNLSQSMLSVFPTTASPSVFYSFRQNSTTAKAFSFDVVGTATSLNLNNSPFTVNSTSLIASTLIITPALTIGTLPTTSAGTYDFLTRNTSTGVVEKVTSASVATTAFVTTVASKWTQTANDITNINSGNVGINVTSPTTGKLVVKASGVADSAHAFSVLSTGGVERAYIESTGNINAQYVYGTVLNSNIFQDASGSTSLVNTSGSWVSSKQIKAPTLNTTGYTVATLPTGIIGAMAYVTDALAPSYMATVVGGGSVVIPVFYNGTNWVAH